MKSFAHDGCLKNISIQRTIQHNKYKFVRRLVVMDEAWMVMYELFPSPAPKMVNIQFISPRYWIKVGPNCQAKDFSADLVYSNTANFHAFYQNITNHKSITHEKLLFAANIFI